MSTTEALKLSVSDAFPTSDTRFLLGRYQFLLYGTFGGGTVQVYVNDIALTDGAFTALASKELALVGNIKIVLTGSSGGNVKLTLNKIPS